MSFRFRVWDRLPQTSHDWPELGRVLSFQGETISFHIDINVNTFDFLDASH